MSRMDRFYNFVAAHVGIVIVVVFCLCVAAYIIWGTFPNSSFSADALRDLSPEQVIAQVGPPDSPPAQYLKLNWTEEDELEKGPLVLTWEDRYSWRGFGYSVVFRRGKVAQVLIGHK